MNKTLEFGTLKKKEKRIQELKETTLKSSRARVLWSQVNKNKF